MSSSPTETIVDIVLPAMGTSISEGTVIEWHKQVGDPVAIDEVICEISTDKVDTDCPSPVAGVVTEILVAVGQTVDVGTIIARVATGDGPTLSAPPDAPAPAIEEPAATNGHTSGASNGRSQRYSPVVQRMSEVHGVDLADVPGTGRGGRVTKRDVLAYLKQAPTESALHSDSPYIADEPAVAASTPPAAAPDDRGGHLQPLSRMRQAIGAAMRNSLQTAATCHTVVECDFTRVEKRRRDLGVTALPLVARAVIDVLRSDFPALNATLDGTTLTRYDRVHLGIAVSLGDEGLIVPVIHDAQDLSPDGLSARIKDLATRARAKQLAPDEVQGATFTITNPGRSGAVIATPIINVPQVAILDLEAVVRRPVVVTDGDGNEMIAIRSMVNLVLGWDHRAIDGVYAAEFLTAVRRQLESVS